jgi:inner membrane protein
MASVFGHILASSALGYSLFPKQLRPATLALAGFCAFAPDLDVLGFYLGISYGSPWGHRGFTHSLFFALFFGLLMARLLRDRTTGRTSAGLALWCVLSTASHPLLDMLTNGGRGCALWWPFNAERLFFPARPILVSPIGAGAFFSDWGLRVLWSELVWIGLPALGATLFVGAARAVLSFLKASSAPDSAHKGD